MSKINKEKLKELANNLLFTMSENEYEILSEEFDIILEQMKLIGEISNIDELKPMTFPFEIDSTGFREDVVGESLPIEDVLKNVKDHSSSQIKISKVVK